MLTLILLAACGGNPEGHLPGECEDGADNDADGDYDCDDSDCTGAPACNLEDEDDDDDASTDEGGDGGDGGGDGGGGDGGDGGGPGGEGGFDTAIEDCSTLQATVPEDGDRDVYYRDELELEFDDAPADLSVDVPGVSGSLVEQDDGDTVYWIPSGGLEPDTDYEVELSWCGGYRAVTLEFTTSDYGRPLTASVEGRVYRVDVSSGRVRIPSGVGSVMEQYLDAETLIEVAGASGSQLELRAAPVDEDTTEQDMCAAVVDLPSADFSENPYFEVGPLDVQMDIAGMTVEVIDQYTAGTFAPDGSSIGGLRMSGEIDTRSMSDLVGSEDPGAICELVQGFGVDCIDCSSDGQPYCMQTEIVDVVAERESGSLVETSRNGTCEDPDDWNSSSTCATGAVGGIWLLPLLGLGRRSS